MPSVVVLVSGIVTDVIFVQSANASLPISVTDAGIVRSPNAAELQPLNALSQIFVSVFGRGMEGRPEQP